jgi:Ca-activated chloride channel family protein
MHRLVVVIVAVSLVSSCSMPAFSGGSYGPTDFGATVGGTKDIGQARKVIEQGLVPTASMITAEGLFSEHDFAAEGDGCSELFCARPAVGTHRLRSTNTDETFVHVALRSGLGPEWKRPPADLMAVVDRSSMMAVDMKETLHAVTVMVDNLRPDDRFGLIVYDDRATVLIPLGPVTDKEATKKTIREVTVRGSTTAQVPAVELATTELGNARQTGRMSRLMMFACALPPMGDPRFDTIVKDNANAGVALSFFGILAGGGYDSARYFTSHRGGNAYFLGSLKDIETVFDTDFDFVITPLAYDFSLSLSLGTVGVKRVWGLPNDTQKLAATTIFPSRRKGAIVMQLDSAPPSDGVVKLGFEPATDATPRSEIAPVLSETKGGVRKVVALVNLADGMKKALDLWLTGERPAARAEVTSLVADTKAEAEALDDAGLRKEVAMLEQLLTNMSK